MSNQALMHFPPCCALLLCLCVRRCLRSGQFGLIMTSMSAGFSFDRRVLRNRATKVTFYSILNMGIPALISFLLYHALPQTDQWRGQNFDAGAYFVLIIC